MTAFFSQLPQIVYKIGDQQRLVTNLLVSIRRREDFMANRVMFKYTIEDGDTPEIVADKVYSHTMYWWVVLLSAGIIKPDMWPQSNDDLAQYLIRWYGDDETWKTQSTLVDNDGNPLPRRVRRTFVDEKGNTVDWHENTEGLGSESFGVIKMRGNSVFVEDKLIETNDAKREIMLLDPVHLESFILDFQTRVNERIPDGTVDF